ncbi:Ff.00g079230.m01.CDS01 [Fusarium sp. VM40]|nr:Ff.00g079230.m01.CDS01 [Fusarium sp. VM40]
MSSRASNKRQSTGAPASARAPKRARTVHSGANDEKSPSRRWARGILRCISELPSSDLAAALGIIPDTITDTWSQEDEDFIQAVWDESPEKQEVSRINNSKNAALLKLWKCHLRVLRTSPHRVISPLFNLRYQTQGNNNATVRGTFSLAFCNSFTALLLHPCWKAKVDRIVWALQYAVICRLDDRRNWPAASLGVKDSCPALKSLYEELSAMGNLPRTLHSMHVSARGRILRDGETPSVYSNLLHRIGEMVLAKETRRPRVSPDNLTYMGVEVLPLTGWDLEIIREAVDSMAFPDPKWQFPVSEAYESFMIENDHKRGPTVKKLPELFELTFKGMLREVRLNTRPQSEIDNSTSDIPMDQEIGPEEESEEEVEESEGSEEESEENSDEDEEEDEEDEEEPENVPGSGTEAPESEPRESIPRESEPRESIPRESEPSHEDDFLGGFDGFDLGNEEDNDISAPAGDDRTPSRSNTGAPFPTRFRRAGDNGRTLSSLFPNGPPPITPIYGSSANTLTIDRDAFDTLLQEHESLEAENESRKEEIRSLKAKTESLEADHASLEDELVSLEEDHASLEGYHASLEEDYKSLEKDYRSLQSRTMNLEADNVSLHSKTMNLEADNVSLHSKTLSLETKFAELERQFIASQARVAVPQVTQSDKASGATPRATGPDTGLNPETEHQRPGPRPDPQPETSTGVQDEDDGMDETHQESSHPVEKLTEKVVEPDQTSQSIPTGENTQGEVPQSQAPEQDARDKGQEPASTGKAPEKEAPVKPNSGKVISFGVPRHSDTPMRSLRIRHGKKRLFASRFGSMATRAVDDDPGKMKPSFQNSMYKDLDGFLK